MKQNSAHLLKLAALFVLTSIIEARPIDSVRAKGEILFRSYCQRCHGAAGTGTVNISQNSVWRKDPSALVRIISFGARGPSFAKNGYHRAMPPAPYNDAEIAYVTMYAMQQIGKREVTISSDDVRLIRRQHLDSVRRKMDRNR